MADFTVGQAQLKLVPSFEGFNEAVKAEGEKIDDIRIGVLVDDDDANAKLDALKLKADELGAKSPTITPKVDSTEAVTQLGAVKSAADAAAGGAGSGGGGIFGLAAAAASLGPALVPIGATLTAGIGALVPILLSAGTGVGAFALAASGDLKGLKADLTDTLTAFQKLTQPIVEPVIGDALKLVIPIFSELVPLVDSTAGELDKLANSAKSALEAPFWRSFITFIDSQAAPAIGSLSTLFGGVAKAFAGVTVAFGPLITGLEGDLAGIGNSLANFGANANSNSGLQAFIAYVEREAPAVGQLIINLGTDIGRLVSDLAPLGAGVVAVLGPITQFAGELLAIHGPFGSNIVDVGLAIFAYTKLAPLIESAQANLLAFSVTAKGVEGVAGGSSSGLATLVAELGGIGAAAALAIPILAGVGAAVALDQVTSRVQNAVQTQQQYNDALSQLTGHVSDLTQVNNRIGSIQESIAKLGLTIPQAISWEDLSPSPDVAAKIAGLSNTARNALDDYVNSLGKLQGEQKTAQDNLSELADKFGLNQKAAESLATSLNINLTKALDPQQLAQFRAELQQQAAQAGLTAAAFKAMAAADGASFADMLKAGNAAAATAATAWSNYGNAVTAFSGSTLPVSAFEIAKFYATQAQQGAQFSSNIQKAIKDGYDPTLISNILQAGPAQASNLLQGLVSAQGTGLKNLIAQTTAALTAEGAEGVEEARLYAEAIAAKSSKTAADLSTALAISQALTTTNAAGQLQALSSTLFGGYSAIQAIAAEYGIAIPDAVKAQIDPASGQADAQAQAVIHAIEGNVGAAGAAGAAVGAAITAGIAAGMTAKTALDVIGASAAAVVAQAVADAQKDAKISSPSKLFADEVGVYLTQGIAVGMVSAAALTPLAGAARQAVGSALSAATGVGQTRAPLSSAPSIPTSSTSSLAQYSARAAMPRLNLQLQPAAAGPAAAGGDINFNGTLIQSPADASALAMQLTFLRNAGRL